MILYSNTPLIAIQLSLEFSPTRTNFFWNSTPTLLFKKLFAEKNVYWTEERKELATQRGLNPVTAYIIASIVEEETRATSEKDTMASVYLNRFHQGMRYKQIQR
jgi:UPF0755 protein